RLLPGRDPVARSHTRCEPMPPAAAMDRGRSSRGCGKALGPRTTCRSSSELREARIVFSVILLTQKGCELLHSIFSITRGVCMYAPGRRCAGGAKRLPLRHVRQPVWSPLAHGAHIVACKCAPLLVGLVRGGELVLV